MAAVLAPGKVDTTTKADDAGVFSAERLPWLICLALSVLYFFFFYTTPFDCAYQPNGFCVTHYEPNEKQCAPGGNSHQWAFLVDAAFTLLVLGIGFLLPEGKYGNAGPKNAVSNALIIFGHGCLHAYLGYALPFGNDVPCEFTPSPASDGQNPWLNVNTLLYAAFIFALCYVGFAMVSSIGDQTLLVVALSATCMYLIVEASFKDPANPNVSAIFGGTQLLVSLIAAVFPKEGLTLTKQGYFFIAPCLISLVELLGCCSGDGPGAFNTSGGHVWYDIALHTTVTVFQLSGPTTTKAKSS